MRAVPDVGSITPVSIEIVWVLPAPLGPSRPKTSPSSTEKLMPLTASKSPYFFTRLSTSRMAGIELLLSLVEHVRRGFPLVLDGASRERTRVHSVLPSPSPSTTASFGLPRVTRELLRHTYAA